MEEFAQGEHHGTLCKSWHYADQLMMSLPIAIVTAAVSLAAAKYIILFATEVSEPCCEVAEIFLEIFGITEMQK